MNVARGINETSRMTLIRRIASNKPATRVDMLGDFGATWQATPFRYIGQKFLFPSSSHSPFFSYNFSFSLLPTLFPPREPRGPKRSPATKDNDFTPLSARPRYPRCYSHWKAPYTRRCVFLSRRINSPARGMFARANDLRGAIAAQRLRRVNRVV